MIREHAGWPRSSTQRPKRTHPWRHAVANSAEDLDDETRAKAEAKMEKDNDYEPSGSGRIPGSKYTITEVDIMDCEDKKDLEKTVTEHSETSRGESSCCGGKGGLLVDWEWVPDISAAAAQIRYAPGSYMAHQKWSASVGTGHARAGF